ncbi:hypothetical protein JW921_09740 [Candidatus Fermentibacterales bacterium]|nr:hypothetical protein [Candidatus Fermentibacterales bacterium]
MKTQHGPKILTEGSGRSRSPLCVVLALVLLLPASALAQGYGPPPGGGMGPGPGTHHEMREGPGPEGGMPMEFQRLHRLLAVLDLTEDQRESIEQIVASAREGIAAIRESREGEVFSPSDFGVLFAREDLSIADLEQYFDRGSDFREEVLSVVLESLVDIHDVLDSEQLSRIELLCELAEIAGPGRI